MRFDRWQHPKSWRLARLVWTHWHKVDHDTQARAFRAQLELAADRQAGDFTAATLRRTL
jgi:hypothetical protein